MIFLSGLLPNPNRNPLRNNWKLLWMKNQGNGKGTLADQAYMPICTGGVHIARNQQPITMLGYSTIIVRIAVQRWKKQRKIKGQFKQKGGDAMQSSADDYVRLHTVPQ